MSMRRRVVQFGLTVLLLAICWRAYHGDLSSQGGRAGANVRGLNGDPPRRPSSTPTATATATSTATGTPTLSASPSPSVSVSPSASAWPEGEYVADSPPVPPAEYRRTQYHPTPFPATYQSRLTAAARRASVTAVPDVFSGHRSLKGQGAGTEPCPPHGQGQAVLAGTQTQLFDQPGLIPLDTGLWAPTLKDLSRFTLGLAVVSHDSPATLSSTLASWKASGIYDLVDDRVALLSAPQPEEIALALSHGFRVYTPHPDEVAKVKARSMGYLGRFSEEAVKAFPFSRNIEKDATKPARWATYVAQAQILLYMDMAVDFIIFAEKDYALPANLPREQLIRSLLASTALVASGTAAVRLRRMDDPNREALPDCCQGECGNGYSSFGVRCAWESHLNWLGIFCDPNVLSTSGGQVKLCLAEEGNTRAPAAGDGSGSGGGDVAQGPSASKTVPTIPPQGFTLALGAEGAAGKQEEAANASASSPVSPSGPVVEPLSFYCFSSDHSGWSNNVAMFSRAWWTETLGHVAVHSAEDNGSFEVNAHLWCEYAPKYKLGAGSDGLTHPFVCQLAPGLFYHVEKDGRR